MDPFKFMESNFPKIVKGLSILGVTIIIIQILLSHPSVNRVLVLITRLEGR